LRLKMTCWKPIPLKKSDKLIDRTVLTKRALNHSKVVSMDNFFVGTLAEDLLNAIRTTATNLPDLN